MANESKRNANQKLVEALKEKLSRLQIETQNAQRALAVYLKADNSRLIKETQQQVLNLKKQINQTETEIKSVK